MLACIACVKEGGGGGGREDAARSGSPTGVGAGAGDTPTCRDPVKSLTSQLKDMVLKLSGSGTQRQGQGQKRGGSPPPRGRTTSLYRSGYYRPGVVQDDMAVPPATYLGTSGSTPARAEGGSEAREWTAQVEPGVQITFVSLPGGGGNDLKRIRFSREMYDKWQAQKWWGDHSDRIMELYNVRRFARQVLPTPPRSDDGDPQSRRESFYSQASPSASASAAATPDSGIAWGLGAAARPPPAASDAAARQHSFRPLSPPPPSSSNGAGKSPASDAARMTTASSISNASELEATEWVIQDEPGVYITVRELPDGTRELRRVRFSRERFAELNAKLWWEENKERIQAQYL